MRAAGEGRVCRISERDYNRFLSVYPQAQRAANRAVVAKMRSATARRVEFATCTATARLARILLELVMAHGVPASGGYLIDIDLTQVEMATLAGVTESTMQRILTGLRRDRLLDTGYRRVHVLDVRRLHDIADL